MKTLVFGSLNIDKTYLVDDFVQDSQTISADRLDYFCGGKGFNQAIALKRAGNEVYFAGAVGADGDALIKTLDSNGIDRRFVKISASDTGHAIIQLNKKGQNCIIIFAGANQDIHSTDVDAALSFFEAGDLIVLQNEISCGSEIMNKAHSKGMIVAFNPSPYNNKIKLCDLSSVDYLLINENEGESMTGISEPDQMLDKIHLEYPLLNVLLTLGSDGSIYLSQNGIKTRQGIYKVEAVDTTAAGDTFAGYFLSELVIKHSTISRTLKMASIAAGLAVSKKGAEPSIPYYQNVEQLLEE